MKTSCTAEVGKLEPANGSLTCDRLSASDIGPVSHHAYVEVNLIRRGTLTYWHGGEQIRVHAPRLVTFWSAIPHQIVGATPEAEYYRITIPLAPFFQYRLPCGFTHLVFDGHVLVEPQAASPNDLDMFERWTEDLRGRLPAHGRMVMLELEARLLRFAEDLEVQSGFPSSSRKGRPACDLNGVGRLQQMLCFIAQNYTDEITAELISRSAGLHPSHAMNLFRKTLGTSLVNYVMRLRVCRAQQMLAASNKKIVDVAMSSGFNSLSRFNDAFKKACGCSPRDYRERFRAAYDFMHAAA